jgi:hypothetical protein
LLFAQLPCVQVATVLLLLHPENVYDTPVPEVCVKVGVVPVFIASLNVIMTLWVIETLVAPLFGVLAVTVGAVVSGCAVVVKLQEAAVPVLPATSL